VVAATNRDLAAEVRARRFREDLLYRLNSAVVLIPSLRERPADIPVLARRFLAAARARAAALPLALTPEASLALRRHLWPGNVRELRNAMDYVAACVAVGPPATGQAQRAPAPGAHSGHRGKRVCGVAG
jgi:two-component system response regulator AtoC